MSNIHNICDNSTNRIHYVIYLHMMNELFAKLSLPHKTCCGYKTAPQSQTRRVGVIYMTYDKAFKSIVHKVDLQKWLYRNYGKSLYT